MRLQALGRQPSLACALLGLAGLPAWPPLTLSAPPADTLEVDPLSFGAPSLFSGASFRGQTVVGGELPLPTVDPSEWLCLPTQEAASGYSW